MDQSIGDHRRHSGIQGVTSYGLMDMDEASEGCSTPTRDEYKIHVGSAPPPPPRKKPAPASVAARRKRAVPKNGYFQPPDLDSFFATCNCNLAHIICNN